MVLTRMSGTLELFMGKGKPFGTSFNITEWSGDRFRKPYMFTTLSKKSHVESKRLLASLYSQSYSQSSPELKETSRVIVSGRMRNQLHTWALKHATVNTLEEHRGLHYRVVVWTRKWQGFPGQRHSSGASSWGLHTRVCGFLLAQRIRHSAKLTERFYVHLIPQATHRSRHLIEELNAGMCRTVYNRKPHQSCSCRKVNSTTS